MTSSGQSAGSSPVGDGLDMLDLSDYNDMQYQSPTTNKIQFARPTPAIATTPTTMPTSQMLSGPSHQYDQYKQQTPFVPGALANALAMNESNGLTTGGYQLNYIQPGDELFDFNASPSHDPMTSPSMDLDFDSPMDTQFYLPTTSTVNPHNTAMTSPITAQAAGVGRMYPGMHQQQAALAKAKAQQMMQQQQQQQELIQRQNQQRRQPQAKQSRLKAPPTDPIVEQKIAQLLNSMRTKPSSSEVEDDAPLLQVTRPKKEEDDMDDDERLLASEEGKKLSSKERRQLRNKVSARAFRSRRKEYIGQLESEIAAKVNENGELRSTNRALLEENRRLSELTKTLLSSSAFKSFLDTLSTNPASQMQVQMEQRQPEPTQALKDPNPYHTMNLGQHQQIGMVMMPEPRVDFSMLSLNADGFGYQPQVYAVLETPELPQIDTDALMGKSSNFVGESLTLDSDKADAPSIEVPVTPAVEEVQASEANASSSRTDSVVVNLDGDIFDDDDGCASPPSQPLELDTDGFSAIDIFGGIEPEKAFARYELVDSSEEDKIASMALGRVERLAASLATTLSALERLDIGL
jgi:hypothetical protein